MPASAPATPGAKPQANPTADGTLSIVAGARGRGAGSADAGAARRVSARDVGTRPPVEGSAVCGPCAALCDGRDREKKNAARRGRYARLRVLGLCTDCGGQSSGGVARCEPCARRSYVSSGEHRGLPLYPPRYTVVELATGEDHGTWDSWEEVAMCLAFAKLSRHEVEVITEASPMTTITAWG